MDELGRVLIEFTQPLNLIQFIYQIILFYFLEFAEMKIKTVDEFRV